MTHFSCSVLLALEKNTTPYVAWYTAKLGGSKNDLSKPTDRSHFFPSRAIDPYDHEHESRDACRWCKPSYTRLPTADMLSSTLPSQVRARAIAMSPVAVNSLAVNCLIFTGDDLYPPHNHQLLQKHWLWLVWYFRLRMGIIC